MIAADVSGRDGGADVGSIRVRRERGKETEATNPIQGIYSRWLPQCQKQRRELANNFAAGKPSPAVGTVVAQSPRKTANDGCEI